MTFEKNFTDSIEFLTSFDSRFKLDKEACALLETTFRKTNERSMQEPFFSTRQKVCELARQYSEQDNIDTYSYQCLADSHVFLKSCIEQNVIQDKYMTLTVGDVSFQGKRLFKTSRSTMLDAVVDGISTQDEPLFHVWLTLADMTVIDFTILDHLSRKRVLPLSVKLDQRLTIWRPERKAQFDYHPILVDDDFLARLQKPIQ